MADFFAYYSFRYYPNGNRSNLYLTSNCLHLIQNVKQEGTALAYYSYLADGTKLSATDGAGDGLLYRGSLVYKKQGDVFSLESGGFNSGRFVATNNGIEPYFHVTDHLGSVRVAMNAQGAVVEQNDYYPFGMRWDGGQLSGNEIPYGIILHKTSITLDNINICQNQCGKKVLIKINTRKF